MLEFLRLPTLTHTGAVPMERQYRCAECFGQTMKYKSILLFGAPGSGKGTQGKILSAIPGFYHTSTGDIFRTLDLQSEAGRGFWEHARRGGLVPDEFTINVWKNYIKGMEMINQFHPETDILVLDGVPRN